MNTVKPTVRFALLSIALAIYQLILLSTKGQTIGKQIMGLRIVKRETGLPTDPPK